mgnify:CR=1 FL=1
MRAAEFANIIRRHREVDATEGKIVQKLFLLGAPLMLSMMVENSYELANSFWLGRYGSAAIACTQVSRNLIWFITSLAFGIGIGGSTLISQSKGAKNREGIEQYEIGREHI